MNRGRSDLQTAYRPFHLSPRRSASELNLRAPLLLFTRQNVTSDPFPQRYPTCAYGGTCPKCRTVTTESHLLPTQRSRPSALGKQGVSALRAISADSRVSRLAIGGQPLSGGLRGDNGLRPDRKWQRRPTVVTIETLLKADTAKLVEIVSFDAKVKREAVAASNTAKEK
jgi:hypothetical protein